VNGLLSRSLSFDFQHLVVDDLPAINTVTPAEVYNKRVIDLLIDAISEIVEWTKSDTAAAASELSPSVGIPEPVLVKALERQSYGVKSLDDSVVAQQQAIADTFFQLKLIPKKVTIVEAVHRSKA